MNEHPAFTRRGFLATSMAMVSAASSVPLFIERAAYASEPTTASSRTRSQPGVPQDRVLVVVELNGGNDGLNTIIPYRDDAYYRARPSLAVPRGEVLNVARSSDVGLHPSLASLQSLYDQGLAAIVHGVGYPNPNRSHFASMDIWHTADTTGGRGLGWIGRALDEQKQHAPDSVSSTACVTIGTDAPLVTHGQIVKPISFQSANLFRWVGGDLHPALAEAYDELNRVDPETIDAMAKDDVTHFVLRTSLDAQLASDQIRKAVASQPATRFPNGPLAGQLRMVAAMIRSELPTRVYYVSLGGFDTHANQPGGHARQLEQFAIAMKGFYDELAAIGQASRVLTLAFSEFGRRVYQNASNGTDHGTAGPTFLFGPMVRPGLLGEHPSLDKLENGDLIYNVDFRCVYAAVLERWMRINSRAVLGQSFRLANVLA